MFKKKIKTDVQNIQDKIERFDKGLTEIKDGTKTLGDGAKLMSDGIKSISNGIGTLLAGNIDVSKLTSLDCANNYFSFTPSADVYLNYSDIQASVKNPVNLEDLKLTFVEVQPCKRIENMAWLQAWDVKTLDGTIATFYTKSYLVMATVKISDVKRNLSAITQIPLALPNGFSRDPADPQLEYKEEDMLRRILSDPDHPNSNHLSIKDFTQFVSEGKITGVLIKANSIVLTTIPKV